jgi:pyrimidine and pyridine-specific 5'-nucleotidase
VAHLVEDDVTPPKTPASKYQIRHLEELRTILPHFFKSDGSQFFKADGSQSFKTNGSQ